jgi:hypothetical protein
MKPHITVDEISSMQNLEELIAESKKSLQEWYDNALEIEHGNVCRAIDRMLGGIACGTLQTALDRGVEIQEEEGHGSTLFEMAKPIACSPALIGCIALIVGDKPSDCEVVVDESELDEGGDLCVHSSRQ